MSSHNLRPRERDALIQSLRAGVTPRLGARHIQVGRDAEIAALGHDIDRIGAGGATIRLVIGEYGSGKTFFLNLVRSEAVITHVAKVDTTGLNIVVAFEPTEKLSAVHQSPVQSHGAFGGQEALPKMTVIVERLESLENRFVSSLGRMESLFESLVLEREKLDAAFDLIKQLPASLSAEIDELRRLLKNAAQQVSMTEPNRISPEIPAAASSRSYASLPQFLQGLIETEGISLVELRRHLLPLDLLPSAVIEQISEMTFDLVGEAALEEDGERVTVYREALVRVLETWDTPSARVID